MCSHHFFEPLFDDGSYGYRPQRSPHQCLDALGRTLQHKRVNILVEADIRGFFDAVHHEWLLKFLRQRIGDERVLRLISRMLKAGIMEDGLVQVAEVGTPQGSMLSPLLSNVYLHYGFDHRAGHFRPLGMAEGVVKFPVLQALRCFYRGPSSAGVAGAMIKASRSLPITPHSDTQSLRTGLES